MLLSLSVATLNAGDWSVDSNEQWQSNQGFLENMDLEDGLVSPNAESAFFSSVIKSYPEKRRAEAITLSQSSAWLNWNPAGNTGPVVVKGAPVFLRRAEGDYWLFGAANKVAPKAGSSEVRLEGFDMPSSALNKAYSKTR